MPTQVDWNKLPIKDRQRRVEILTYLQADKEGKNETLPPHHPSTLVYMPHW